MTHHQPTANPLRQPEQRTSLPRQLFAPHAVIYLLVVLAVAGYAIGLDAALLMLLGVVVAASAATLALAFQSRTRWMRYSLRTALIAITGLCLLLGWIVNEVRDRRLAVATIERLGGRVSFADRLDAKQDSPVEQWLWRLLGDRYMGTVDNLGLESTGVTDADLAALEQLTELRHLDLDYTKIGDEGIEHLAGLQHLLWLDVEDTQITDDALATIGKLSALDSLILDGTAVSDDGLRRLEGMQSLGRLRLRRTAITDAGLDHLAQIKSLKSVDLEGTVVTQAGVEKFRQALPQCQVRWDDPNASK